MPRHLHSPLSRAALIGLALDFALFHAAQLPWHRLLLPSGSVEIALPGWQPIALAFSPTRPLLAIGLRRQSPTSRGGIALIDAESGAVRKIASDLPGDIVALAFLPDDAHLALETGAGQIFLRESDGKLSPAPRVLDIHFPARTQAVSPGGRFLALFQDDRIEMRTAGGRRAGPWERRFGVRGHHLEIDEASGGTTLWAQWMPDAAAQGGALAFSHDGDWLLCGEPNQVSFLRTADGEIRRRRFIPGFTGALASAPNGEVALCLRESVVLWPGALRP